MENIQHTPPVFINKRALFTGDPGKPGFLLDIKYCFKNFDLTLHQKHNNTFYKCTDGILPEKLPFIRAKKLLGNYNMSDEDIAMLIDELYKLSVITYKIYSK